jgi:4-aminobutyrate aminotransferase-like enzyme/Ser/Thr protein kinase RdoA (MazF antagonist)
MSSEARKQARPALVETAPAFSIADAVRLARELYGIDAAAAPLPSERDQNFLLTAADGQRFVLKIANSAESRGNLEFENAALEHLAGRLRGVAVPRLIPAREGRIITEASGASGARHFVRLVSWLPGVCFAQVKPHSRELLESLGAAVAELGRALEGFSHPAMHREFHWDLQRVPETRRLAECITAADQRTRVEKLFDRFEREALPVLAALPAGVIYNDANDYNVLVSPPDSTERRVTGIVDFGDMVRGPRVCDLAVAAAYALLGKPDPAAAAAHVVRGYHAAWPLEERELAILLHLICARLALSVTISAWQRSRAPANDYLRISEEQAWAALARLEDSPPQMAHYAFRDACGLPAVPQSAHIVSWLRENAASAAPVVQPDLRTAKVRVLDLGVASAELPATLELTDTPAFTAHVFGALREASAAAGIGRYNEARLWYRGNQFLREGNDGPERRTVHIAIDIFMEASTPVHSPFAARVHSFRDNNLPYDYGSTIILEHDAGGVPFWTLYGHLSRESLDGLKEGAAIARGQRIGALGNDKVNGGWPPHLHFQIIADTLGMRGDFPGVAAPSQLRIWQSISPDANLILQIPQSAFPAPAKTAEEILATRKRSMSAALRVSYREPLHLVRGAKQFLYDADGRSYLDAVNNVPHVGHSHPRVAEAVERQMSLLNSNTRYLYGVLAEYVERLTAKFPEPLRVCFLVNSGSEANELALRLARAHTRRRDVIVLDGAYHGNTTSLIEVSPYKFNGPGGEGCPPHVRVVPTPDPYRGPYKRNDPQAGARYAEHVAEAIDAEKQRAVPLHSDNKIGAFLFESYPSAAGVIVPAEGFLREACAHVRAAGGVCIADEVQVGFGRLGSHFWGFVAQGIVPDIVTLGKPIGNGFPLGAVVTTPEIAASFANGMEFFSTFGGNPVACAAGLAVLDVLEDEGLQANARDVGKQLLAGLRRLAEKFPIIGDVRGSGFFIGVELVRDRATLAPAAPQAAYIAERMRDRGILIGSEGPLHNVLKIRPPMCFSSADAEFLLSTMEIILSEDCAQP